MNTPQPPHTEEFQLTATDKAFHWGFQHWLGILNILILLYAGLPWLSPLLIYLGYERAGELLFALYTPLCHQAAGSSFHWLGHQVAFCQRETAMYTTLFLAGLVFSRVRHTTTLPILPLWVGGLLLLPMFLDGSTHIIGNLSPTLDLRSPDDSIGSLNFWLRMTTGILFALAVVGVLYPRLDRDLRGLDEA